MNSLDKIKTQQEKLNKRMNFYNKREEMTTILSPSHMSDDKLKIYNSNESNQYIKDILENESIDSELREKIKNREKIDDQTFIDILYGESTDFNNKISEIEDSIEDSQMDLFGKDYNKKKELVINILEKVDLVRTYYSDFRFNELFIKLSKFIDSDKTIKDFDIVELKKIKNVVVLYISMLRKIKAIHTFQNNKEKEIEVLNDSVRLLYHKKIGSLSLVENFMDLNYKNIIKIIEKILINKIYDLYTHISEMNEWSTKYYTKHDILGQNISFADDKFPSKIQDFYIKTVLKHGTNEDAAYLEQKIKDVKLIQNGYSTLIGETFNGEKIMDESYIKNIESLYLEIISIYGDDKFKLLSEKILKESKKTLNSYNNIKKEIKFLKSNKITSQDISTRSQLDGFKMSIGPNTSSVFTSTQIPIPINRQALRGVVYQ